MITISLNGKHIHTQTANLAAFLAAQNIPQNGIAVAINQTIAPRSQWDTIQLTDGDKIDIVEALVGG